MSELVPAGTYQAKIVDYAVSKTKSNGRGMPTVKFETPHGLVFWNGTIHGEPEDRSITLEALIVMGLKSFDDLEKIADGPTSGILNMDTEVSVVVKHEVYEGKTRAKVQYVNRASGTDFRAAISSKEFKTIIGETPGLKAKFAAAYQAVNGPRQASRPSAPAAVATDIPF